MEKEGFGSPILPSPPISAEALEGLFKACDEGDIPAVTAFLDRYPHLLSYKHEETEQTLLHVAATKGHLMLVQSLVDRAANQWAAAQQQRHPTTRSYDAPTAAGQSTVPQESTTASYHAPTVKEYIEMMDKRTRTALFYPAQFGHLLVVQYLIEQGADVGAATDHLWTPLHEAAFRGHLHIVQCMVEKGHADLEMKDKYQQTVLIVAGKNQAVVDYLLAKGADATAKRMDERTDQQLAAINDYTFIPSANNAGSSLVAQGELSLQARLFYACEFNDLATISTLLLSHPSMIHTTEKTHQLTLLHLACARGHQQIIDYLVQRGANLEAITTEGATPLYYAVTGGHLPCVQYLVQRGARIDAANHKQWTPLHQAACRGFLPVVEYLIEQGHADIEAKNWHLITPVLMAASHGRLSVVEYLTKRGADIKARSGGGWSALHSAAAHSQLAVAHFLVENGADLELREQFGSTALHWACSFNNLQVAQYLLEMGADAEARDNKGRTALDMALSETHMQVARYLQSKAWLTPKDPQKTATVRLDQLLILNADGSAVAPGRRLKIIGQGFFGEVFLVQLAGQRYACKELEDRAALKKGVEILACLDHPHLMRLHSLVLGEGGEGAAPVVGYLMDVMDSTLLDYMQLRRDRGLPLVRQLALNIAQGLSHLHSKGIIHQDLHSNNVLMKGDQAVITDFYCERNASVTTRALTRAFTSMTSIVPPECRTTNPAPFEPSFDMYGYGLLIAQLVRAVGPGYESKDWQNLLDDDAWRGRHVREAERVCSGTDYGDLAYVIKMCLASNPAWRPTALEVVGVLSGEKRPAVGGDDVRMEVTPELFGSRPSYKADEGYIAQKRPEGGGYIIRSMNSNSKESYIIEPRNEDGYIMQTKEKGGSNDDDEGPYVVTPKDDGSGGYIVLRSNKRKRDAQGYIVESLGGNGDFIVRAREEEEEEDHHSGGYIVLKQQVGDPDGIEYMAVPLVAALSHGDKVLVEHLEKQSVATLVSIVELQYKLFGLCQENNLMQAKKLLGGCSGTDLRVVLDCRDSHGKSYYDHATRLGHLQLAGFLQGLMQEVMGTGATREGLHVWTFDEVTRAAQGFGPQTLLGIGGFARVYRGELDGEKVAIKEAPEMYSLPRNNLIITMFICMGGVGAQVLKEEDYHNAGPNQRREMESMFEAEVKVLGRFHHPNLVHLLGSAHGDKGSGKLALIYELLEGGSLRQRMFASPSSPPLTFRHRLEIAIGVARGLSYLHGQTEQGQSLHGQPVLHRDIKSSNIGLTADWRMAKILDYGLAKPIKGGRGGATMTMGIHTMTGGAKGTSPYMSLEALKGKYGVQSDIYSLGIVLFEMFTGRPADVDTADDIQEATNEGSEPQGLSSFLDTAIRGQVPAVVLEQLWELVNSCVRSRAKDRPRTAGDVLTRLEGLLTQLGYDPGAGSPTKQHEVVVAETSLMPASKKLAGSSGEIAVVCQVCGEQSLTKEGRDGLGGGTLCPHCLESGAVTRIKGEGLAIGPEDAATRMMLGEV